MTLEAALRQGSKLLEEAGVQAPRLTAEVLLSHAIGRDRVYLYTHPEQELERIPWIHYGRYLHERMGGKPTQYITRKQEFYGRDFRVTPDVLIPRPETEHLVETALQLARGARSILDVGCGSGAIAVTLQLETGARVLATDISHSALLVAESNARRLGASVEFVECDVSSAIASEAVDLLVSNPPYIPQSEEPYLPREVRDFEPHKALFGGPTGLEIYARLIDDAKRVVRPGGWLMVELGFKLEASVRGLLSPCWEEIQVVPDLAGIPRVLAARKAAA
ncbi:MAG: peptide chain release factor N(5)-glutamine methyltransferase [Bryobacteraceae bacterium]|nr:peptide chain release factor N(5)-glutamine methyltransferase [Bryobacteraceae bacterium]